MRIKTLCSFQMYVLTQGVRLSGPAQGANQNASFQRRPVQLHNKSGSNI